MCDGLNGTPQLKPQPVYETRKKKNLCLGISTDSF